LKVTLDLAKLRDEGSITASEYDRLAALGRRETSQVLVSILVGFGVVAVSAGALMLMPNTETLTLLGLILMALGLGLALSGRPELSLPANICFLPGALLLSAGIILLTQGVITIQGDGPEHGAIMSLSAAAILIAVLLAGSAALARSALLACLAVLALFSAVGGGTYYDFASYGLEVTQPLGTVLLFSALALGTFLVSLRLAHDWQRLAIVMARTSVFLVNLGFWIGSLWGDDLTWLGHAAGSNALSPAAFTIAWAVALIAIGVWAAYANRRWVLNLAAVFGGIHFYTQWFDHLGADPASVLIAGILVLVFAVLLRELNRRLAPAPRT
jgi:iron complex transport system permease protein